MNLKHRSQLFVFLKVFKFWAKFARNQRHSTNFWVPKSWELCVRYICGVTVTFLVSKTRLLTPKIDWDVLFCTISNYFKLTKPRRGKRLSMPLNEKNHTSNQHISTFPYFPRGTPFREIKAIRYCSSFIIYWWWDTVVPRSLCLCAMLWSWIDMSILASATVPQFSTGILFEALS